MFKRFSVLTFAPLALLLIPLIAMHYSDEVHWTLIDFAIMGVLLLVAGMWTQRVVKRVKSFPRRATYIILVILLFLLVWAELAVGIFDSPLAGN
jgi:ABC-type enterobactin transport system permease subunit